MEYKRSEYLAAATDLINVMGLKGDGGEVLSIGPKTNGEELKQFITSCFTEIDPEVDEFAVHTLSVLKHLGFTGFETAEETTAEETTPVVNENPPVPAPVVEQEWKEKDPKQLLALQIASVRKMEELKAFVSKNPGIFATLVPKLDTFTGLEGAIALKKEMKQLVGSPEDIMNGKKPVATQSKATGPREGSGASQITAYKKAHPEAKAAEIAAAVGCTPARVHNHIAAMKKKGIL